MNNLEISVCRYCGRRADETPRCPCPVAPGAVDASLQDDATAALSAELTRRIVNGEGVAK